MRRVYRRAAGVTSRGRASTITSLSASVLTTDATMQVLKKSDGTVLVV